MSTPKDDLQTGTNKCECNHFHFGPCPYCLCKISCEDLKKGNIRDDRVITASEVLAFSPSCYWDTLLEKQMCPKHVVPVAECPVDHIDVKFQDKAVPVDKAYIGPSPLLQDKPIEGGTFDVNHYSVYCQTCDHPSLWHWIETTDTDATKTACRGWECKCRRNMPGEPVPTMCDLCKHPIRWHDKKGPRCTAFNCPCGRTAA